MATLDHWIKAEALNVFQIALLLEGIDPAPLERLGYQGLPQELQDRTTVHVVGIKNAVRTEDLWPRIAAFDELGDRDWVLTLFDITSIKSWFWIRGMKQTVFGPYSPTKKSPSQQFSKFYAPKLAAGNAAWEAVVSDSALRRGKSPKQALETWLTEHAAEYGLVNKDGSPNKTGIEEIAKVANWNQKGGAPATPTVSAQPSPAFGQTTGKVVENAPLTAITWGEEDEIPF
ncbi:hypothetical protein EV667_0867 [Ancylobacter aquaticus]|uniref:Uncharacterized protein n=1 Tax=Ancylobacter aquaticus TaxID=100 RepID=A0A4R1I5Y7_ANCAQ|nr:hypothetical protein [Ancylobacter aquaticus]TCK30767.1 hypothetical protein EV667_0867 [Ancylobacter aquaticus]